MPPPISSRSSPPSKNKNKNKNKPNQKQHPHRPALRRSTRSTRASTPQPPTSAPPASAPFAPSLPNSATHTSPPPHHNTTPHLHLLTPLNQQQTNPKHSPNPPSASTPAITSSPISSHHQTPQHHTNHSSPQNAPTPPPPIHPPDHYHSHRTDDPVALANAAAAAAAADHHSGNNPHSTPQTEPRLCSCCSKLINPSTDPASTSELLVCRKCCTYLKSSDVECHYRLIHSSPSSTFAVCLHCLPVLASRPDDDPSRQRMFARDNVPDPAADQAAFAAAAAAAQAAAANDMSSAGHPHLVNPSSTALATGSLANGAQNQFGLAISDPQAAFNAAQQNHLFDARDQAQPGLNSQGSPVFSIAHPEDQQGQTRMQVQVQGNQQQQQAQQAAQLSRKGKRGAAAHGRQAAVAQATHHMVGQHHIQASQAGQQIGRAQQVRNEQMYQQERGGQGSHVQQGLPQIMSRDGNHQQPQIVQQQQQQAGAQHHGAGMRASTGTFNGAQMPEQTGAQFGFDDVNRRRQMPPTSGHPTSVMLGFSDNYMQQQQDAINDGRSRPIAISEPLPHQQREFQARFDGDPNTMVQQTMTYDIKEENMENKRIITSAANATAEAVLTPTPVDTSAVNRAAAAPLPPNMVASRSTARIGPDGRPIASSAVFIHGTVEKRVACESCGLLFGDVGSLKRHAARAHRAATGKGPVYCSQCNASLKNEQNLRRHIAVCHSGEQEHRCEMCTASFSSRGSLRIHQQQVHAMPSASSKAGRGRGRGGGAGGRGGSRARAGISKSSKSDKSYVCDMCTDTFKWKGNLKRHRELRHLQLRPFVCRICNANFGTKSNMRVHLITHNNGTQAQK